MERERERRRDREGEGGEKTVLIQIEREREREGEREREERKGEMRCMFFDLWPNEIILCIFLLIGGLEVQQKKTKLFLLAFLTVSFYFH